MENCLKYQKLLLEFFQIKDQQYEQQQPGAVLSCVQSSISANYQLRPQLASSVLCDKRPGHNTQYCEEAAAQDRSAAIQPFINCR